MKNPFDVVRDFENAVAEYCGAPYCVSVSSCTDALQLCLEYVSKLNKNTTEWNGIKWTDKITIEIPKHTYIGVASQIKRTGFNISFRDEQWSGMYKLEPFWLYDSARRFTSNMCSSLLSRLEDHSYWVCVSFHRSKTLGFTQGGAILTNCSESVPWLKRMRFDGRMEGVSTKIQAETSGFTELGAHCYMSPDIAAGLLAKLHHLPKYNPDLPNDDYPNLSLMSIFK